MSPAEHFLEMIFGYLEKLVALLGPLLTVILVCTIAYVYFKYLRRSIRNGGILFIGHAKNEEGKGAITEGGNGKDKNDILTDALFQMHLETVKINSVRLINVLMMAMRGLRNIMISLLKLMRM
jgi:hypothetical protein